MKMHTANNRKYRHSNPLKAKAHWAINNAVRSGKITRQPCEACGVQPAHAHHDDYSKPLDVRWLCHKHHELHHHGPDDQRPCRKDRGQYYRAYHQKTYVPRGRKTRAMLHDIAPMIEMRSSGMSFLEIGKRFNLSKSQVFKLLQNPNYK